jgi:bloom syndrome protein
MIDDADVDANEKKRQKDGLNEVVNYCRNTVVCRRVQVLKHFGQDFDKADCHKFCDNCMNESAVVVHDMTEVAVKAIQLAKNMLKGRFNLTKTYLADVLKGSKKRAIVDNGHDKEPFHGAAKDLHPDRINRLIDDLEDRGAFKPKLVKNNAGYSNTYLIVSLQPTAVVGEPHLLSFSLASKRTRSWAVRSA